MRVGAIVLDVTSKFGLPEDRVWLNASHQGPLPLKAAEAVAEMVKWKLEPHHLKPSAAFSDLIDRLRSSLAGLIGANEDAVVLANSASYGLHLVANGLNLASGDEVIVAANDFPSDILPWLRLEQFGVQVTQLQPKAEVLSASEVAAAITPRTRVVCLTWVHSFSGHVVDLDAIGEVCQANDTLFMVNAAQGIGGIPLAVHDHPIDALTSVGHKWLCGPYGTGFCWLGERAAERVQPTKRYWLAAATAEDMMLPDFDITAVDPPKKGQHDVFATANFFNFAAWVESIALVADTGVPRIHAHNLDLAARLVDAVDQSRYEILDRGDTARLSSIVFVRPLARTVEQVAADLDRARIDIAQRRGLIRLAAHFYNSTDDVDRAATELNAAG